MMKKVGLVLLAGYLLGYFGAFLVIVINKWGKDSWIHMFIEASTRAFAWPHELYFFFFVN